MHPSAWPWSIDFALRESLGAAHPISTDSMDRERRAHLAPLTSVRFFAALYVVVFHLAPPEVRATELGRRFADGGYIGVSFFFILSGFILGWNYLPRYADGRIPPREFWRARLARVYPVYVLALLASAPYFVLRVLREQPTHSAAAFELGRVSTLVLTLTQSWIPRYATAWNSPAWSLSVEAFFYALFPLLAVGVVAIPKRRVTRVLAATCGAALVAPALYLLLRPDGLAFPRFNSDGSWLDGLRYMPLPHLPQFGAGLVAARWLLDRESAPGASRIGDVTWPVLGLAALALALLMTVGYYPLYAFVHDGLLAPIFLAIIVLLARGGGPLVRLLSRPTLTLLGEASYGLYLLHLPVSVWLMIVGKRFGLDLDAGHGALAFALYLPLAILTSVVALRTVEEPMRRAIRSGRLPKLGWRRADPAAAPPG